MIHLTKIYTKTGDEGMTSLADNTRIGIGTDIIAAIGAVDEANSAIGMVEHYIDVIETIQNDLFDIGAELAGSKNFNLSENKVSDLEDLIDDYNMHLEPLNSFVLPTGAYHHARTVVRRAERELWKINADINPNITKYLNRLSDLLFVMARYHNKGSEKLWIPEKHR